MTLAHGCGTDDDAGGQIGSVRYEDRELTNVQVTLHRAAPQGFDKVAIGLTQADGKFRLRSPEGRPITLSPGQYRVTLEHLGDTTWAFDNNLAKPETSRLDFAHHDSAAELVIVPPSNSVLLLR